MEKLIDWAYGLMERNDIDEDTMKEGGYGFWAVFKYALCALLLISLLSIDHLWRKFLLGLLSICRVFWGICLIVVWMIRQMTKETTEEILYLVDRSRQ